MVLVLGLGNPGARYERTRHNVGWMALDAAAERLRTDFRPAKGEYYVAEGSWRGRKVALVKPTTYMNNSGLAARQALAAYGLRPEEMLVVVDELQFPVGRIALKPSGSSGGHNGIESVIEHLGTGSFPRLRCGIGNDFGPGGMSDYVLGSFSDEEREDAAEMVKRASEAILLWVMQGTAKAMNMVNTRSPAVSSPAKKSSDKPELNASTSPDQGGERTPGPDDGKTE